mmetsp:Transcript_9828/g.35050  ORF Transcript_9828/g.35050 Transcript_9828/m.35050 type:complete len:175 (-) Transcript_9828:63-587(-)
MGRADGAGVPVESGDGWRDQRQARGRDQGVRLGHRQARHNFEGPPGHEFRVLEQKSKLCTLLRNQKNYNSRNVSIFPFPLASTPPVGSQRSPGSRSFVALEAWTRIGIPVDSILLAVFTVSPKRQNLGILHPTTPVITSPLCSPILIFTGCPCGSVTWPAARSASRQKFAIFDA